jgi:lipopolysaccharide export LptBFGC system permease protein LptF
MKNLIILGAMASMFSFANVQNVAILSENSITTSINQTMGDEIKVKIRNRSSQSQDLYYTNAKGGGKSTKTLSGNTTATITIEVGGKIYTKSGTLLLTVTADMADTEQTIIR